MHFECSEFSSQKTLDSYSSALFYFKHTAKRGVGGGAPLAAMLCVFLWSCFKHPIFNSKGARHSRVALLWIFGVYIYRICWCLLNIYILSNAVIGIWNKIFLFWQCENNITYAFNLIQIKVESVWIYLFKKLRFTSNYIWGHQ